jgi:hypothetical protein
METLALDDMQVARKCTHFYGRFAGNLEMETLVLYDLQVAYVENRA